MEEHVTNLDTDVKNLELGPFEENILDFMVRDDKIQLTDAQRKLEKFMRQPTSSKPVP